MQRTLIENRLEPFSVIAEAACSINEEFTRNYKLDAHFLNKDSAVPHSFHLLHLHNVI